MFPCWQFLGTGVVMSSSKNPLIFHAGEDDNFKIRKGGVGGKKRFAADGGKKTMLLQYIYYCSIFVPDLVRRIGSGI